MTMGIIKKWATDTLYNSVDYQTYCTGLIGQTLNFYRSSPTNKVAEALPFMTVFSDEYEVDPQNAGSWNETFVLPIALAIESDEDSKDDTNITVWDSTDTVELLAREAFKILRTEANGCGIKGEAISVLRMNLVVSEIGYADDCQASMFIEFGKLNGL